jgi:hypothetical protein
LEQGVGSVELTVVPVAGHLSLPSRNTTNESKQQTELKQDP